MKLLGCCLIALLMLPACGSPPSGEAPGGTAPPHRQSSAKPPPQDSEVSPPQDAQPPHLAWEKSWDRITTAALTSTGSCIAVVTPTAATALDSRGQELWTWNFGARPIVASRIAISPQCDWAALAGDSGYRYVWIIHRDGTGKFLKIDGTPLGVAINHAGNRLAIGTGKSEVWLVSPDGALQWRERVCCLAEEFAFSEDDATLAILRSGTGIMTASGKMVWSSGLNEMKTSRDFKTFVGSFAPPHGAGFRGIRLLDANGKELWEKFSGNSVSVLSPDGTVVAALIDDDQVESEAKMYEDPHKAYSLTLLDRAGKVLKSLPLKEAPIAVFSGGQEIITRSDPFGTSLAAWAADGRQLWTLSEPGGLSEIRFTPDGGAMVLWSERSIYWLSLR